ncbi:hypothetical protein C8J57DRAFT_1248045 [Mycena rebaudengoi]|nr:hypothetical protein C8J57DRAFT_1248045 [Mycena rebaudengoi]
MGPHGQQAIVQMNALVLGVFVHLNGLTTFRKLSEADEDQLSSDMVDVEQNITIFAACIFTGILKYCNKNWSKLRRSFKKLGQSWQPALADQEQSGLELDAEHQLNEAGRKQLGVLEEEVWLETSRVQGQAFISQVEQLESKLAKKSTHLENEIIKVADYEKIILQMKEECSQLEKENQDMSIKMQTMEKKWKLKVTDTTNDTHKICQENIKELVDQITEKDQKFEEIKEAVESKENQVQQGLRTIHNYMEELEAKQIEIQDLQLRSEDNPVPHDPQSLAAELDYTDSLNYMVPWLCSAENRWQRRHTQLEISMHSLKESIQTYQNQSIELQSQMQNLQLEYDVVYEECQITKQTLKNPRSLEDKSKNQGVEFDLRNEELQDLQLKYDAVYRECRITKGTLKLQNLHLKYDVIYRECQISKETLQSLEEQRINWEAEQIRMKQTCTELRSENNAIKKRADGWRDRLSDTQQKLKRAQIQWNDIKASNQLKLDALAEEVILVKSELAEAQMKMGLNIQDKYTMVRMSPAKGIEKIETF